MDDICLRESGSKQHMGNRLKAKAKKKPNIQTTTTTTKMQRVRSQRKRRRKYEKLGQSKILQDTNMKWVGKKMKSRSLL